MTNQEILKKAIEKAKSNGFELDKHKHFCEIGRDIFTGEVQSLNAYQSIIFDHDFAKAFWKQQGLPTEAGEYEWELRLQDMVLEQDPIKYLEKFI